MAGTILSVDIGTSSLKAALIDFSGKLRAWSRTAYSRSVYSGDVDVISWEKAFIQTTKNLRDKLDHCSVEGICISGNGPTLVPVTSEGEALPPLFWYGGKTEAPVEVKDKAKSFFLPHAAWFKKNAPENYAETKLFISSHEWLAHRLGAEAHTVLPQPSYEVFYWDEEQLRLFGLDRIKFPPFIKTGAVMGKVSVEAVSFFSLAGLIKSGTPIIAGGPDFITALIGTGTMECGEVCDRAGSSEGVNVCTDAPVSVKQAGDFRVLPHVREGLWNIGSLIPQSGRLFEWYRARTGQEGRAYEDLLAELIPSNEDGDAELHFGESSDPDLMRNLLSPFSRIIPAGDFRPELLRNKIYFGRAVLCSMGLAVRTAIGKLKAAGLAVREMKLSGGQVKNARWNQLKADISGVKLLVPRITDGELAGNAALAAAALEKTSIEETVHRMIRITDIYEPLPENAAFWTERGKG